MLGFSVVDHCPMLHRAKDTKGCDGKGDERDGVPWHGVSPSAKC